MDLHRITHLPYRPWCPECVEGFAPEWPHRHKEVQRLIPLISCNYLYLSETGIFAWDELVEEERQGSMRVLAAYCSATKALFAHAVPRKGDDSEGYAVEQLKQDALWLGHSKITIRGDNEPALFQVIDRALAALRLAGVESAVPEGSFPYDPQTNGAAENAVKLLKGTLKANPLSLERQIQARIPLDHPVVTWLVTYSAYVRTSRVRGREGNTAQQRARGTTHPDKLVPFGEVCGYKTRAREGGIAGTAWRWSTGTWLGIEQRTGQYVLHDKAMGGYSTLAPYFVCKNHSSTPLTSSRMWR